MIERRYHVCVWEGEGSADDPMFTGRSIFVRHHLGEQVTTQMVIDQFTAEVGHYRPGLYRLYPADRVIDLTIHPTVTVQYPKENI